MIKESIAEDRSALLKQDYHALLDYTSSLNDLLHHYKIPGSQRSLLISSVLIALGDPQFRGSYLIYDKPAKLADLLVDTVCDTLMKANISGRKNDKLHVQFSFIRTDMSLSTQQGVLKDLIISIEKNVHAFIRSHRYQDVLGQLYIGFLRYANSDKGLGIVLTPPHIAELMAALADVGSSSVVYDNCTGTGGLLISAMGCMSGSGGEMHNQLIGVEFQSHIYALACANMYIHREGKTNVINASCFDKKTIEQVKLMRPTKGLLNPPYKADRKNDIEELEFVINNLSCLQPGGTCVAIVPMPCAISHNGKIGELKKRLMADHSLEAVLSMPDDLFYNSNVGVVSCIMIFTAHRAHPSDKKTFFGYYKVDGFVKQKNSGRTDVFSRWEAIKKQWLRCYAERITVPGLTLNKAVSASDEWCAEAFMETDYSVLRKEDFESVVRSYISFRVSREYLDILVKPVCDQLPGLDTQHWKSFVYKDIFTFRNGYYNKKPVVSESGSIPFIGATEYNNGVTGYYSIEDITAHHKDHKSSGHDAAVKLFPSNCVTVSNNGSVGCAFYQDQKFTCSHDVNVLFLRGREWNRYIALFICTLIHLEKYRWSFGRKWRPARMPYSEIRLPVKNNEEIDWKFMEDYIKALPYSASL